MIGFVLLFGGAAFAQDAPKVEVTGNYSYMRFNPENSNIIAPFSLNGGGLSGVYFFNTMIGIKAEFEGYADTTRNLKATGTPVSANLFTYNVGPEFKFRTPHFEPFVDAMFGGAHSNAFVNVCNATECVGSPSNNAFDFILGGGIDIPITKSIRHPAGRGGLRTDPLRQCFHNRQQQPEQPPLPGWYPVPVLVTTGASSIEHQIEDRGTREKHRSPESCMNSGPIVTMRWRST